MEGLRRIGDKVCCWLVRVLQLFPVCAAEEVLNHFRAQFIAAVDASAIVHELKHESIISNGDVNTILKTSDETQQNEYLHARLLKTCDEDALRDVCKIIDVKGTRNMKTLGNEMMKMLGSGGNCCVCKYM